MRLRPRGGACKTAAAVSEPRTHVPIALPTRPTQKTSVACSLLYSGGLDTSVMLRWIQERYGAEVVTLTVNLGQPDEN